jgi:hypothetical protein
MTNLTIKLAVVGGLAVTLAHEGDRALVDMLATGAGPTRPVVATEPVAAPPAMAPAVRRAPPRRAARVQPASLSAAHLSEPLPVVLPAPAVVLDRAALPTALADQPERPAAAASASTFADSVARLGAQAEHVDRLWEAYKSTCQVRVRRQYDFGREWFALWDRALESADETPQCTDLVWRVLQSGESVRHELLAARTYARANALSPETEAGMLRWHGLEWK